MLLTLLKINRYKQYFFFMNKNYMQMYVMFSKHPHNLFVFSEFVSTCYECSNDFDHYLETSYQVDTNSGKCK